MQIRNARFNELLQSGSEPLRLNIGGGNDRIEGYFNVDRVPLENVDIVADLNRQLDQIPDSCIDEIYSCHAFEHIENINGLMEEIFRIGKPGARLVIRVPHFSSPHYYSDPTHVRPWGLYLMNYYMDPEDQLGRVVPAYYSSARFTWESRMIVFSRSSLFDRILVPLLRGCFRRFPGSLDVYEKRWCWIYPASELSLVCRVKKDQDPALTAVSAEAVT